MSDRKKDWDDLDDTASDDVGFTMVEEDEDAQDAVSRSSPRHQRGWISGAEQRHRRRRCRRVPVR